MRKIKDTTTVKLDKSVHERCCKDKDHFQETIGDGKWSISDTIKEYQKIIDLTKEV